MKTALGLPLKDWNTYYQEVPADDVDWELGGPSYELIQSIAEGLLVPPARVLDIGCGLGSQSIYLSKQGFEAIGIDIAETAVGKARKLAQFSGVSPSFQVADVLSLPFATESFDITYDRACFHHLKPHEQFRYRNEVSRVTTDGGTLLLVVFAQAFSAQELEQFFVPNFSLYDETIYTTTEKKTGNTITWRSLLFEKQLPPFGDLN